MASGPPRHTPNGEHGHDPRNQAEQQHLVKGQTIDVRLQLLLGCPAEPDLADEQAADEVARRGNQPQPAGRCPPRYQLGDEIAAAEKALSNAVGELSGLGVSLIDDEAGEVDFPTRINGRPAAFSWRLGDQELAHWHYQGEEQRRPIPTDWKQ